MAPYRSLPTYVARYLRSHCMSSSVAPCANSDADASNAFHQDHWGTGRHNNVGNTLRRFDVRLGIFLESGEGFESRVGNLVLPNFPQTDRIVKVSKKRELGGTHFACESH
jgi:hypothetical protein